MCSPFGFSIQNSFLYLSYCQKWPLHVNFRYPFAENDFFSQCSTPLVGMKFWGHVPNSLKNTNMERHIPNLL
jgi:hypothetical protein